MILDTYETDGVPAPKDCELVDTRERYVVAHVPKFTFNTFCARAGITLDRDEWHKFVTEHLGVNAALPEYGPGGWWWWYKAYRCRADALDQAETQQDALR